MRKRLLGILLTLSMVVSLMPAGAYGTQSTRGANSVQRVTANTAENAETSRKTLQFGGDVIKYNDYVYIGKWKDFTNSYNLKWRVIDDKTNLGEKGLFLLSDMVIGKVVYTPEYQGNNPVWQNSDAQKWCMKFAGEEENTLIDKGEQQSFSELENSTIIRTTEPGSTENPKLLHDDTVFFLSLSEVDGENSERYGLNDWRGLKTAPLKDSYASEAWLLRDAPNLIDATGRLSEWKVEERPKMAYGTRPAFNMNPDVVVMTSKASGGKPETTEGSLAAVTPYDGDRNEWKLTLRDDSRKGFTASTAEQNICPGATISVDYSGAAIGGNEYISAIITDRSDNILYYGRLAKAENSSGTTQLTVPADLTATGRYSIKIFNEQYNGDNKTDCVGDFIEICTFNNAQSTQFDSSRITGYQSGYDYIYYGQQNGSPIKWRVLDNKANNGEEGLFLLSEKVLGETRFNDKNNNDWQGSEAQRWCESFAAGDAFSDRERNEIIATDKSDEGYDGINGGLYKYEKSDNILAGDKVFFLSAAEACNPDFGFTDKASRAASKASNNEKEMHWWLRSPYSEEEKAVSVDYDGTLSPQVVAGDVHISGYANSGTRPAFNLSKGNILFISAASNAKGKTVGDNLTPVNEYRGSEWKLTLKDESRNGFTAEANATENITAGNTIRIKYSGAKEGANEYVSAMILDQNGSLRYYGHITNNLASKADAPVTIPSDLAVGNYTLRLFSEQDNGDYRSDYAGNMVDIPITIAGRDTTAPKIRFAVTTRTSPTTAEVDFRSTETGYYYYALNGTPDTSGSGVRFYGDREIIKIKDLIPNRAYGVNIIVKDLAGNISKEGYGVIPAEFSYKVNLDANGGEIADEKNMDSYISGQETTLPAAEDVTRAGCTFAGWYTNDDFSGAPVTKISENATGDLTFYAKWTADEQFSLAPGDTYYFDLFALGIPGTPNGGTENGAVSLPDTTLHYVPFTYAGVVDAYKLNSESDSYTDDQYAKASKYAHSLFIAENNITNFVSWNQLNEKDMIFSKAYSSNGISYSLRTPSAGGSGQIGSTETATPHSNEWDSILNKEERYIKNWTKLYSWGQDKYQSGGGTIYLGSKVMRGYDSSRSLNLCTSSDEYSYVGFRPVMEVLNTGALGTDGLKSVTLDLNGGRLGESTNINIIVKNEDGFTAPTCVGLTPPEGNSADGFTWKDSDGKAYEPGASVPASVTSLTAQWSTNVQNYTVTLDAGEGSFSDGEKTKEISYTGGTEQSLSTTETPTRNSYDFKGWYADSECTGTVITKISAADTGNKTLYAKWVYNNAPKFNELEAGKVYCGRKTFGISTNTTDFTVRVGDKELERVNGGSLGIRYALEAGLGLVTVTVTGEGGASSSVTVIVNDGHTPAQDGGDCTTPIKCIFCDAVVKYAEQQHSFASNWSKDSKKHWHECRNEGCMIKDSEAQHSGGTATCISKASCELCGVQYGDVSSTHRMYHFAAKAATKTEEGNIEYWQCAICGRYFKDTAGAQEITKADIITAKLPAGGGSSGGSSTDPGKPGTNPGQPTDPGSAIDPGQPTDPTGDEAAKITKGKAIIADLDLIARSRKTAKKNIEVTLKEEARIKEAMKKLNALGFTVKYRFYRSTKKTSGYKSVATKKTAAYTNTQGKKGTKYYYKIQLRVYDEKGKLIAKTALKQCKHARRTWAK